MLVIKIFLGLFQKQIQKDIITNLVPTVNFWNNIQKD